MEGDRRKYVLFIMFFITLILAGISIYLATNQVVPDSSVSDGDKFVITNLGGYGTNPSATSSSLRGVTCNANGCTGGTWTVSWDCGGRQTQCTNNENNFNTTSGLACGVTRQIDVFDKNCRVGGWSCSVGGANSNLMNYVVVYNDCTTSNPPGGDDPVDSDPPPDDGPTQVCMQVCETDADCKGSTMGNPVACRPVDGVNRCVNLDCPTDTVYGTRCDCDLPADRLCGQACGANNFGLCSQGQNLGCTYARKSECSKEGTSQQNSAIAYCVPRGTMSGGKGPIPDSWYPNDTRDFGRAGCSASNVNNLYTASGNNFIYHPIQGTNFNRLWTQQEVIDYICNPPVVTPVPFCGDSIMNQDSEECELSQEGLCGANSECNVQTCLCEDDPVVVELSCGATCNPNSTTAVCGDDHTCDPTTNLCTLNQCLDGNCADECTPYTPPDSCGDSCNPLSPTDSCTAIGHVCDPTGRCVLPACEGNAACTDNGCTLPYCGDGKCQTGETCEVTNPSATDPSQYIYGTCNTVNAVPGSPAQNVCRNVQGSYVAPASGSCSFCGDGQMQAAFEQCDFNSPGSQDCTTSCQLVTPVCEELVSADQDGVIGDGESVVFTLRYTKIQDGNPYPNIRLIVHAVGDPSTRFGRDANNTTSVIVAPFEFPASNDTNTTKIYRFRWEAIDAGGVTFVPDANYESSVLLDYTNDPGSLVTTPDPMCIPPIEVNNAEPPEPAFIVEKDDAQSCHTNGDAQINYTITVTNVGEGAGDIDVIEDTIDPDLVADGIVPFNISSGGVYSNGVITWTPAGGEETYAAGESKQYTFSVTIPEDDILSYSTPGVDNNVTVTDINDNVDSYEVNTELSCDPPPVVIVPPSVIPGTGIFDDQSRFILIGAIFIMIGIYVMKYDIGRDRVRKLLKKAYISSPMSSYEERIEDDSEKYFSGEDRSKK